MVRSLSWENPLEEGMATHSSILSWRIPMDRETWRATVFGTAKSRTRQCMCSHVHTRVCTRTHTHKHTYTHKLQCRGCRFNPWLGNKIAQAAEQLSLHTTTSESRHYNEKYYMMQGRPNIAKK